ncbi:MAG: hypothetical protein M1833_003962 [Piccolia ochrophora]|nr:MAG: hypothetical protein M1833_003962 [Piccolia ochrophora]
MFLALGKRSRPEDEDEDATAEAHMRFDRKKRRVLPIRTSPMATYSSLIASHDPIRDESNDYSQPPALTPSDSVDDDDDTSPDKHAFSSPLHGLNTSQSDASFLNVDHQDDDFDMADSLPPYSPRSFSLHSPHLASTRIPTPMFGSFFLRPPASSTGGSDVIMETDEDGYLPQPYERRPLPSPIRETEVMTPMSGAGIMMDRLGFGEQADLETSHQEPARGRERLRSEDRGVRTKKTTLSLGYRADCEKCRAKVPGHYSHVVRC